MTLEKELATLKKKEQEIRSKIKENKSRKKFLCGCGKMHAIKNCALIWTHWYEGPHGCTDGDTWHSGEIQIICPITHIRNRAIFERPEWEHREKYDYCAESQFKREYALAGLFKSTVDEYDSRPYFHNGTLDYRNGPIPPENKGNYYNVYFDKNWKKFGLNVKGRESEK
jgi:hypothetical protein